MLRVLHDMARLDRVYMVSLFNDLKECYDRIRSSLNTITLRRMGCPRGVAICQAEALRKMKHAIKTTYGISETISADNENKLGGIGQGSSEGPVSWHSQMLALIDSYEELIPHREFFKSHDKTLQISQWLVGFVDNNTILFTVKDPLFARENIQNLFKMADECLEVWQKLVVITGGDVELDKSALSVLAWEESGGKEKMVQRDKIEGKLTLQLSKLPGYSEDVKMRDPTHGEETLGVYVTMNGKDTKEYEERLEKVKELAGNIKDNSLDRHDAHTIYRERWVNSIGYCLRVTQFSKTQCEGLMKPFYAAILPKMGFN